MLQTRWCTYELPHGMLCNHSSVTSPFHTRAGHALKARSNHLGTGFSVLEQDTLSTSWMLLWNATLLWYFYFCVFTCQAELSERVGESTWALNKPCNVQYQLFVAEWQRICSQAIPFAFIGWILWILQMKEHMGSPDIWSDQGHCSA